MPAYCEPWPVEEKRHLRRHAPPPRAIMRAQRLARLSRKCPRQRSRGRRADDRQPMRKMRAPRIRRVADIARARSGRSSPDTPHTAAASCPQRRALLRRQRQHVRGRSVRPPVASGAGASSTITCAFVPLKPNELTPAHAAGPRGQTASSRRQRRSAFAPTAMCGLSSGSAGGRESRRAAAQDHLDQARDAGRRLQVADVGLDRADQQRTRSARLRAIAPRRAPAPRSGRRAGCRCRAPRRSRPRRVARPRSPAPGAITASCAGPFGAVRPLLRPSWLTAEPRITARMRSPSAQRVGQPLEHDHAAALAAHDSRRRARRTSCSGRRAPACAPCDSAIDRARASRIRLTPPASASVALAAAQALARQVHRDQRRRAGGVDRDARALAGRGRTRAGRRRRCAQCPMPAYASMLSRSRAVMQLRVVAVADADEDAGRGCRPAGRGRMAGVLERLPGHLEQQALLRVHRRPPRAARCRRTPGRSRRRRSRKPPQRVGHLPGASGIGIVVGVDVPAALGGTSLIASRPSLEQLPERLGLVGAAGKAAADADDGDRLAGAAPRRVELRLELCRKQRRAASGQELIRFGSSSAILSSHLGGLGLAPTSALSLDPESCSISARSSNIVSTRSGGDSVGAGSNSVRMKA